MTRVVHVGAVAAAVLAAVVVPSAGSIAFPGRSAADVWNVIADVKTLARS